MSKSTTNGPRASLAILKPMKSRKAPAADDSVDKADDADGLAAIKAARRNPEALHKLDPGRRIYKKAKK